MAVRHFYDQAYAQHQAAWVIGHPQPAVESLIRRGQFASTVLDVGCGSGDNAIALANAGWQVHGIDVSQVAVEQAIVKSAHDNRAVRFTHRDIIRYRPAHKYGSALDSGVFHGLNLNDRHRYARSVANAVRAGGWVHVVAVKRNEPTEADIGANPAEILDAFAPWVRSGLVRPCAFRVRRGRTFVDFSAALVSMVR